MSSDREVSANQRVLQRLRALIASGVVHGVQSELQVGLGQLCAVRVALRLQDGRSFSTLVSVDGQRGDVESAQERALVRLLSWIEPLTGRQDAEGAPRTGQVNSSAEERQPVYRWDAFWRWARTKGIQNWEQIEGLLGYRPDREDPDALKHTLERVLSQRESS